MSKVTTFPDAIMRLDGGTVFGPVPRIQWEKFVKPDRKNRIVWELNITILEIAGKTILINTGIRTIFRESPGNLRDQFFSFAPGHRILSILKACALTPKKIDYVLLNSLMFTHAGGCVRFDRAGNLVPMFPNAHYYVQEKEYFEAENPNERMALWYDSDSFMPMADHGQLKLVNGDAEIFPGVNVIATGGGSCGHQVILVSTGGERYMFIGDIAPTFHHTNTGVIQSYAYNPEVVMETKHELLTEAERRGWVVVTPHGNDRAGYIETHGGTKLIRPKDLSLKD